LFSHKNNKGIFEVFMNFGRMVTKLWVFYGLFLLGLCGCQGKTRNVILTGFWPPSNQMIADFSMDNQVNPTGWKGRNWRGYGYNVVAFFPTFPGGTQGNPKGSGDFEVDYQDTLADFRRIVDEYKPIAIICYGMGQGPWEIEQNAVVHTKWHDDYLPPTQPDTKWLEKVLPDRHGYSTLPTVAIAAAINHANIGVNAWVDKEGDPGDFLCDYIACLGVAYQKEHDKPSQIDYCAMAGFIHVGPEVKIEQARTAQEITLETVLKSLERLQ
jgi:pyrrolidone-carboxylate peptidase